MPAAKDSEVKSDVKLDPELKMESGIPAESVPPLRPARRRRYFGLWIVEAVLLSVGVWIATSSNPFAEGLQGLAGNKHDQAILDVPFSVAAHNFRYYKFSLPEGSTDVAIVGDFSAAPESDSGKPAGKGQPQETDRGIEVYVLSESAFAVWQTGYATNSVFESGRVSDGKIQATLPTGAGVYYLIFSNKFASKAGKKVNATVLLRYKSWLPQWLRRITSDS